MVFAIEKADKLSDNLDVRNKAFWDGINKLFADTLEMIQEIAKEMGIDLSITDPEIDLALKAQDTAAKDHSLTKEAMSYMKTVDQWFEAAEDLLQAKENQLNLLAELGIPEADSHSDALSINNSIEVILYYHHQIYVKLRRVLHSEFGNDAEDLTGFPKDSDGSAKVALIGIDRSISAWANLRNHLPEENDKILNILISLGQLRKSVEFAFPKARDFKRPGFDEE